MRWSTNWPGSGLRAVVHTCSRKEEELGEFLKKWEGLGFRVTGSVCDLSVREQREELLKKVSSIFDEKLNILSVIDKERRGGYLVKTVQVVPHIADAIQEWIERVAKIPVDGEEGPADVCIIELGGTIGDIEAMPFIEALGQFSYCVGHGNFCLVHVSLVPALNVVGEQKTKPTQHSVRGLRGLGMPVLKEQKAQEAETKG